MDETTITAWEDFLTGYPEAHILQTSTWGSLKSAFGWQAVPVKSGDCGALILFRKLPLGFSFAYLPKGPVGADWVSLWPEVDSICRTRKAIFLRVEPDWSESQTHLAEQQLPGFISGAPVTQPRRTLTVSLEGNDPEWLERMKQKTRYNIRLAEKKDVRVYESQDVNAFFELMQTTGQRDGFGVHSQAYYQKAYDLFAPEKSCVLLFAEYQGTLLAGVMVFARGNRAWYFYGASNDLERQRMPTYLLQFEAMKWAAARGCRFYDMWGVPDFDEDYLEENFSRLSSGLWGVYRFKRGFGGVLNRSAGAWDRVYIPGIYKAFRWWEDRRREKVV